MSWLALDWAETAPVAADIYERHILMQFGGRAKKDGTGCYLSPKTIARRAPCGVQVIEDRIKSLRERGVIAYGDQRLAEHIPANRRPKVYDLMIPHSYYSPSQLRDANEERAERGLGPLPADQRPDLPDAEPSRKVRSDAGTPNPAKTGKRGEPDVQPLTWDDSQGGVVDPPEIQAVEPAGGSTTPLQGGLLDPAGGVYYTPKTFRSNPSEETGGQPTTGHARDVAPAPSPAGPPPDLRPNIDDPATWRCPEHLELVTRDPGADVPRCGKCPRVQAAMQRQRDDRDRAAGASTMADVLAADRAGKACRVCIPDGVDRETGATKWIVARPGTQSPVTPYVRCEHDRSYADVVAELAAAEAEEEEARASRPVPVRGGASRAAIDAARAEYARRGRSAPVAEAS